MRRLYDFVTWPYRVAKYCDEYLRLSVCPLAYLENYVSELHHILIFTASTVAVAWPSFGGVATRYVLPVCG